MSSSSLENLINTQVMYTMIVMDSIESIKALKYLAAFFLSDMARLPQDLTCLLNWCDQNRNVLEIRLHLDRDLLSNMIGIIDDLTN